MPTVSDWKDVVKLKNELYNYYATARGRMQECDTYWSVGYKIRTFKSMEAYKPYKAMRMCQVAVDHLMATGRNVYVPAWGPSEKVLRTSELLQKWGGAVMEMMERQKINPTRVNILHSFLYGMWARRTPIFLKDKWPKRPSTLGLSPEEKRRVMAEYERKRMFTFPFLSIPINPQNFLPDPNVVDPKYVLEFSTKRAGDIRAEYPEWKSGKNDSSEVEVISYWDDEKCCIIADSQPLTDGLEENVMGFIPYEWGYSGLGNEDAKAAPEERIMGIVWPAISSLRSEARIKTAQAALIEQFAFGKMTINKPPANDIRIANTVGEIDIVPDHYNFRVERPPNINPDAWRFLEIVEDDTQFAMASDVLLGSSPISGESGYLRAIRVGQARLRTEGTASSIEAGLASELQKCGRVIRDIIQDKVTIFSFKADSPQQYTVSPDDFKDNPVFFVRFEGATPEEMMLRHRLGLEMLAQRAASRETITKKYFGLDWVEERNKQILERLIEQPEVIATLTPVLLRAYNLEVQKSALEKAVEAARQEQRQVNPDNFPKQRLLGPLGRPTELNSIPEQSNAPL